MTRLSRNHGNISLSLVVTLLLTPFDCLCFINESIYYYVDRHAIHSYVWIPITLTLCEGQFSPKNIGNVPGKTTKKGKRTPTLKTGEHLETHTYKRRVNVSVPLFSTLRDGQKYIA